MSEPTRRAWATIDTGALRKNLAQVRALCPESRIIPAIKANAYGHGLTEVARALAETPGVAAALAVATLSEALTLDALNLKLPILLLNGFVNAEELGLCLEHGIEPVVHSPYQVALLEEQFSKEIFGDKRKLWLKLNTGMNRLGMPPRDVEQAYLNLHKYPGTELVLMSHLAWADCPDSAEAKAFSAAQLKSFAHSQQRLALACKDALPGSLSASAGILTMPEAHFQYVRPGIMIYGSSPLSDQTGEELGLAPAMTLSSRLIAINDVPAGQSIGYGATYTCQQDTRVGVVSIGYGDGYPRAAENGTPVVVKTAAGPVRTRLIGRVSMDLITIDLSAVNEPRIDDEVVLWGQELCVDEVARAAGTIAYELFCKVTTRVAREYV